MLTQTATRALSGISLESAERPTGILSRIVGARIYGSAAEGPVTYPVTAHNGAIVTRHGHPCEGV